jgi:molybdopterin-guanine dinucleotide biosynthesis protein A
MNEERIGAVILAGGASRRMGGMDKGLQLLAGRALVCHVIDCIEPQVDELVISANRNRDRYLALGYPVISDAPQAGEFAGPLAGISAGLAVSRGSAVLFVPCDMPRLPADLAARLKHSLDAAPADVAVAWCAGRLQPVVLMVRRNATVQERLASFFAAGGRRADGWHEGLASVNVEFESAEAFANINTAADLAAAEQRMLRTTP